MLKFLQPFARREVDDIDPNTTVLDYLREHCRAMGTKEGCASGDCGACTVVLAQPGTEGLEYRAVNACITPLGHVHGKQLITVEDLAADGELHPVQRAMVECHGSQCGFCTPGFVMSLFAFWQHHKEATLTDIQEALGGNLCRCTGYRPIIDAAARACAEGGTDRFASAQAATLAALAAIADSEDDITLTRGARRYLAPRSVKQLSRLLTENPGARLVAGATDLALEITQQLHEFDCLVYTGRVAELLTSEETDTALEIGAAVTYRDSSALLCNHFPDLEEHLARLGSLQIRNQGTIGGNIASASPIGDMAPVLLALDAQLRLCRGDDERWLPLEAFFLAYRKTDLRDGEFIRSVRIPLNRAEQTLSVYKISKRTEDDISTLSLAANLSVADGRVDHVRIALRGMAATPRRALACEAALHGKSWCLATVREAASALVEEFAPISDFRGSAQYRSTVAANLLTRLYHERETPDRPLRVSRYA